jgi:hypothetical protein
MPKKSNKSNNSENSQSEESKNSIDSEENIDNVLNSESNNNESNASESENDALDINADTETMNNQLDKHMAKQNKQNKQKQSDTNDENEAPKKICQIDKNVLKTLIVEWLSLDDQIKSYNEVVKDLKEEKKQFESQILELMGTLKQEVILTDKGNLTRTVKESKEPLTPDLIKATLSEILKCTQTADTYTNQIMEKRKVKETVNLKRKDAEGKKGKGKGKGVKQADGGEKKKRVGKKKNDDNNDALDV